MVIIDPVQSFSVFSFKLDFLYTNNEVIYEAIITGLLTAQKPGAKRVKLVRDLNMIIQ